MLLVTWMVKKFTGSFYEKELQKISQKEFRIEKVLKRKGDKFVRGKVMIILLIVGLVKKISQASKRH